MGRVLVASNAGYCFGVRRAIDELERLLGEGRTVYTLGEVIHNPQTVQALKMRGAIPVFSDEELPEGRRSLPGSVAFVPSVAGLIIAGEVIKDLSAPKASLV